MQKTGQLLHHIVQYVYRPADDERMYFVHNTRKRNKAYVERWHFYQTNSAD